MKAMLLAAGFGSRLRPYTDQLAKPAIPFLNLPLLAYPLFQLEKLNVSEVIINTHHRPETVHKAVDRIYPKLKMKINFSHESPNILDSAGGLKKVNDFFKNEEHFIVANADALTLFNHSKGLKPFVDSHINSQALATLHTCEHPGVGTKFGGVWVDEQFQVIDIGKSKPKNYFKGLHYTGYLMLSHKVFDYIPAKESSHIFLDVLLPASLKGEKVMAYSENLEWFETGDIESYKDAAKILYNRYQKKSPEDSYLKTLTDTFEYYKVSPITNSPNKFQEFYKS
ncbi:MAG: NTP transferase domain-containing protein [Bdellovibrionales bacterium]|nr:NTP transferase domain-containing protein [Bdellovibrionales bacterium]